MKTYFLTLLLGFSAIGLAQNTLRGSVSDSNSLPLQGVTVQITDLHKSVLTGSDGIFTITGISAGRKIVEILAPGFASQTLAVEVKPGENTVQITLREKIHEMDEVIVSTAFNRIQSQNVMKVEHASIKSLQQQGVTTLAEGISTLAGVSQVSTGVSIGKPVIRGLTGNRVLVYTQGIRLENQQFGDEHGLGLADAGIESVEVIKGPASLLYGSDALGGVLYFNPEKFAETGKLKADFSQRLFSNTLGSQTSVGVKSSSESWKYLVRGSFASHADYQIPGGDRLTNSRFNESDLKGAIGFTNEKLTSTFRYNFNRLRTGLPESIANQDLTREPEYPSQSIATHIASLKNNFYMSGSTLETNLGYVFNDRSEFEDSPEAALRMKLSTLSYDLKFHFPKGERFTVISGAQGLVQQNRNSGEEMLIPDASVTDFGVFTTTMYDWKSGSAQAGIRYDHRNIDTQQSGSPGDEGYFAAVDRAFDSFNASLGMMQKLNDRFTLRLNAASGFRAPNLSELTSNGVHEGSNRYEIGNSALGNEQNFQTDLNLEFKSSHFEFFVNGFYNLINDYIFLSPTGEFSGENPIYVYNQANAALFGGEAGLHFHPHPLDWLHFESTLEIVKGEDSNGNSLPLIPAPVWDNTIRTEFSLGKWLREGFARLTLSSTFDQNDPGLFESSTKGYVLVNAGFGGKVLLGNTKFDLMLNGANLLDQRYVAHLSRLKPDGIPNIGRNLILSVSFSI